MFCDDADTTGWERCYARLVGEHWCSAAPNNCYTAESLGTQGHQGQAYICGNSYASILLVDVMSKIEFMRVAEIIAVDYTCERTFILMLSSMVAFEGV